ncbi:MAG: beta-propeller domain-containing protein [Betaproteobacteria bacterium]|nr:beta-propeller domain-containing protein [Betaproteobacteria bacterium]
MARLRVYANVIKTVSAACVLALLPVVLSAFLALGNSVAQAAQPTGLRAFASEKELNAWLQEKKNLLEESLRGQDKLNALPNGDINMVDAPPLAAAPKAAAMADTGSSAQSESVTNNQTEGVDEGGIVKVHKNHLVILRRGRLFTVRVGDNALQPVDMQDAFAPGSSGHAWYDEMLVSGNTIVVIGYSYSKGGTEVILFGIDDGGRLTYRATYVLRSNDYYSSRNYASRLIGNTLIFYTPLFLNFHRNPLDNFPAALRWQQNEKPEFRPIAPATRIYRTADDLDPTKESIALHTVTTCKIAEDKLTCSASAVLGPSGREFYVARDAVYVWSVSFHRIDRESANQVPVPASVFRLPLNTQEVPTALKVRGSPIDQFSFLESADGYLNVLLRAEGPVPSMWASELGSHELALLRTPLRGFGDGSASAPLEHYHPLPAPKGGRSLQNRYIGDYLVYGAGHTWERAQGNTFGLAYLLKWNNPGQPEGIVLPHRVDRIEALGKSPLLVGGNEDDLYFSVLDFQPVTSSRQSRETSYINGVKPASKQTARIADTFKLKDAAQGETRSHGFFYKPDTADGESGLLGLPYARSDRPGWKQLKDPSSGIIFLKNDRLRFSEAGALTASLNDQNNDDQCKASCTDWYGNSRPLFVAKRIFALMGYEIVEGKMVNKHLKETRRINFFQKQEKRQ